MANIAHANSRLAPPNTPEVGTMAEMNAPDAWRLVALSCDKLAGFARELSSISESSPADVGRMRRAQAFADLVRAAVNEALSS